MMTRYSDLLRLLLTVLLVVPLDAVTVNPLCPTNKIAPYKRFAHWDSGSVRPRTFDAFYDLLAPSGSQQSRPPNSLQEEPQNDESDDCGEIEDYDETDFSALTRITPQPERRRANVESRLFFSGLFNRPFYNSGSQYGQYPQIYGPQYGQNPQNGHEPQHGQRPQYGQRPQHGQRPQYGQRPQQGQSPQYGSQQQRRPVTSGPTRPNYPATRPPSGGYFGNNPYRPPSYQNPSENFKPVHEEDHETQSTYRPEVVGGPSGHVVGVTAVRPTGRPPTQDELAIRGTTNFERYPPRPTQTPIYTTRRPRPRQLNNNNSVIGSFLDLLLK